MDVMTFHAKLSRGSSNRRILRLPAKVVRALGDAWVLESMTLIGSEAESVSYHRMMVSKCGKNRYVTLDDDAVLNDGDEYQVQVRF